MAGNILAGFVKGFSGTALDSMQNRQADEAETKKLRILEQLRKDTEKEMAVFREGLPSAQMNRKATQASIDNTRHTMLDRDRDFAAKRDDEAFDRGMQEREFASNDRYRQAGIRSLDRSNQPKDSDKMSNSELAKELLYQNDKLVTSALEANNDLTRDEVEEIAYHVMLNARGATPQAVDDDANRRFRMTLRNYSATKPK